MSTAFKKIKDYTPRELDISIEDAIFHCKEHPEGLDFYKILNGIDAYFERRRRKEELAQAAIDEMIDKDFKQREEGNV